MSRTWGVDLSTTPSKTGVVSVEWKAGRPGEFAWHRGEARTREVLVEKIAQTASSEWWAVDVPFGWPDGWAEFVTRHRTGPSALPPAPPGETPWFQVARRVTDRVVTGPGFPDGRHRTPGFSVTFDKLGATAAAWASIECDLHRRGIAIDRSGTGDAVKVCETYPAAAWRLWSQQDNPVSATIAVYKSVLDKVVSPSEGFSWEKLTDHERDALVCAVVARARALERTALPVDHLDVAKQEGWIHLPLADVDLPELLG